jgi:hypothetical protein
VSDGPAERENGHDRLRLEARCVTGAHPRRTAGVDADPYAVFEVAGAPADPARGRWWEVLSAELEGDEKRREELEAERARLIARVAEIDAALSADQQIAA